MPLPAWVLRPLGWLYALGREVDRQAHLWGIHARRQLPATVVSVGNLSMGGTGKTPMTALMAEELQLRALRPVILSRGYGASNPPAKPLIVSDGERLRATPEQAGDEPCMLARLCPGTPIVVHRRRDRAGRVAIRRFDAQALLLDDGFQHDRLERDLDLVLWDVRDHPRWARPVPAGRLRERMGALGRAGAIILTHAEFLTEADRSERLEEVTHGLKRHAPAARIFTAETRIAAARELGLAGEGNILRQLPWPWTGRRVVAVSGLARPDGFASLLRASGATVARHFTYGDHHLYEPNELDAWKVALDQTGSEMIVTTAKDAVKIEQLRLVHLPLTVLDISMGIVEAESWQAFLDHMLGPVAGACMNSLMRPERRDFDFAGRGLPSVH